MKNLFSPNSLASVVSGVIVRENPELKKNKDEIRYGLEWTISGINQILLVVLLALPLNIVPETLLVLMAGAILRMFSGGSHFKSYYMCLAFSTIQILIIGYIVYKYHVFLISIWPIFLLILVLCFWLTAKKSPFLQKKSHLFNRDRLRKQKKFAIIVFLSLSLISIFLSDSLMISIWLALIVQSVTLTNFWENRIKNFDAFLYKLFKGENRVD